MSTIQAAHISTNNIKDSDEDIDTMIFDSGGVKAIFEILPRSLETVQQFHELLQHLLESDITLRIGRIKR